MIGSIDKKLGLIRKFNLNEGEAGWSDVKTSLLSSYQGGGPARLPPAFCH